MLSVSIIIPVYNAEKTIGMILDKLLEQNYDKNYYEVILIDDDSKDQSVSIIEDYVKQHSNIKLYVNSKNQGRSKTRNNGIFHASNELLLFLDADCIPKSKNFIKSHVDFHNRRKNAIGIGSVYFPETSQNPFDKFRDNRENIRNRRINHENLDFVFLSTANMSISKKNILDLGGFDEEFKYWGAEDIELGYRAFKKNLTIGMVDMEGDVLHYDERVNLETYVKRIFYFSKYNIPILLKKHPDIINHFNNYKLLEPISFSNKYLIKKIFVQFVVTRFHGVFKWLINKGWFMNSKYSTFLYKLYVAKFYLEGVKERQI
ncbi:glycosyltransferase [Geobacillus thermodenitrificans]|jgi:glycosyltransferase involved in cell wall biosynthesis|uniref:Glycosyltransferase n=1 Tax=Geobacillus thermodenitrificans (strain NG80-2) TaxID=420246 RepID=A4ITE1_GEOTN|nr:glycosyltransferase family A protein [Geobacillus thermodenitrificans]ABO68595.1 Glycosyltransferase [Geobacillus thermodenitrificans NG80-2]